MTNTKNKSYFEKLQESQSIAPNPTNVDICLQGQFTEKLFAALFDAFDTKNSLMANTALFPEPDLMAGEIDPRIAVEAFSSLMEKKLNTILTIMDAAAKTAVSEISSTRGA